MLRTHTDGITLSVRAQPGAKRTRVLGPHGDELKIAVQAPPIEGRANAALIDFLADTFHIPKSRVTLLQGELSRSKVFLLRGITEAQARTALLTE